MTMSNPRPPIARALAACLALALGDAAAAADCQGSWSQAAARMQANCNIGIAPNEMCLVQRPVSVSPRLRENFSREGDEARIPENLSALTGLERPGGRGFTFLKVVTQAKDGGGNFTPLTQEVVLIAFGETSMTRIENFGPAAAPEPFPVCRGEMHANAVGGGLSASAAGGGEIVSMVPLEEVKLLGRTAAGDRILVKVNNSATGWARNRDIVMFKSGPCQDVSDLTVFDQAQFDDVFLRSQNLARASRFEIESRPVDAADELSCTLDGFPPSGLLIFNPSGAPIQLTVNGVELLMASSALVSEYQDTFSIVVLEGQVTARVAGGRATARAGQAIQVKRRGRSWERPVVDSVARPGLAGPWCNQIYRLARAAYTSRGRLRVPAERINFCRYVGPAGYPIPPEMIAVVEDRPNDDVTPPPETRPPETRPPRGGDAVAPPRLRRGILDVLEDTNDNLR